MPRLTAERLIELLQLEPLPVEGGYFRRMYLASESLRALPVRYSGPRPASSAIYYLLRAGDFSALHRLKTDEIYHFYLGDPVELLLLELNGNSRQIVLGNDFEAGQQVQALVPQGVWQGSRVVVGGDYALLGTTMAPAFDPDDFELGERESLLRQYPAETEMIRALTR